MHAYSVDLRQKIVSAYERGDGAFDEIAELFGGRRRTAARLISIARSGESLWPKPHGGGYPVRLNVGALALLCARLARRPDATLSELRHYLHSRARMRAHPSTVSRALQRLGLGRKKSLEAAEHDEQQRADFRREAINRQRLVFTDETGFNLAITRRFGRVTNVTLVGA